MPRFDFDFEALATADVRCQRLAVGQTNIPAVQRASHAFAMHQPLRQRPALVRAFIVQCENFVVAGAKDGDIAAFLWPNDTRAERRDVFQLADQFPVTNFLILIFSSFIFAYFQALTLGPALAYMVVIGMNCLIGCVSRELDHGSLASFKAATNPANKVRRPSSSSTMRPLT